MGDEKSIFDLTMADLKSGKDFVEPAAKADGTPPGGEAAATRDAKVSFANELGVGASDEIIDIPHRREYDELVAATGGPEKVKETAQALREVVALTGRSYDELIEGLTSEEENAEIVSTIKEWNEILGNPMKAQALLQKIYAHPMQEPGKSYFMGRGSPELNEAIARLWAATTGEKYVRPKSKGDGHVY